MLVNLLKDLNTKADSKYSDLKNTQRTHYFVIFLVLTFALFLGAGFLFGYILNGESLLPGPDPSQDSLQNTEEYYEGRVSYIDPNRYPGEDISYLLSDINGKKLLLLKSRDQKLEVAEGHWVKIYGKKFTTANNEEYVLVEKIVLRQSN